MSIPPAQQDILLPNSEKENVFPVMALMALTFPNSVCLSL